MLAEAERQTPELVRREYVQVYRELRAAGYTAHVPAVPTEPAAPRYGAEGQRPSLYVQDPEGNTVELKGPPGPDPTGRTDA